MSHKLNSNYITAVCFLSPSRYYHIVTAPANSSGQRKRLQVWGPCGEGKRTPEELLKQRVEVCKQDIHQPKCAGCLFEYKYINIITSHLLAKIENIDDIITKMDILTPSRWKFITYHKQKFCFIQWFRSSQMWKSYYFQCIYIKERDSMYFI